METTLNTPEKPSILDSLYALRDKPEADLTTREPEVARVPDAPAGGVKSEAAAGAVETQQTKTEEEDHTPLPPAAQKRLDKLISQNVSLRKELEAKLKANDDKAPVKEGTAPEKPAAEAKSDRPKRPTEPEYGEGEGNENETWDQFIARKRSYRETLGKYEESLEDWTKKALRAEVEHEFTQRQAKEVHEKVLSQARKDHGADFDALTEVVASKAPLELQKAILDLDDWPSVAVYLARNEDRLDEVVAAFAKSSTRAAATLGRIQASLKGHTSKAAPDARTVPEPLKPVGGGAAAGTGIVDLTKVQETPGALLSHLHSNPGLVGKR